MFCIKRFNKDAKGFKDKYELSPHNLGTWPSKNEWYTNSIVGDITSIPFTAERLNCL